MQRQFLLDGGLLLAGVLITTSPRAAQAADLFFVGGRGDGVDLASLGLRFDPFSNLDFPKAAR